MSSENDTFHITVRLGVEEDVIMGAVTKQLTATDSVDNEENMVRLVENMTRELFKRRREKHERK